METTALSMALEELASQMDDDALAVVEPRPPVGNRQRMSDLRESGSIEQDADVVMLLHREEYYHKGDEAWEAENPDKANLAELIVAKQRNGPTGLVELTWDSRATRFRTHDPHA